MGFDVVIAAICWALCAYSVLAMTAGNPTAINGVIGAGIGAVIFTGLAIWDRA